MVVGDERSRSGMHRLLDRMEREGITDQHGSDTGANAGQRLANASGRQRFEQTWLARADGVGRYFVQP